LLDFPWWRISLAVFVQVNGSQRSFRPSMNRRIAATPPALLLQGRFR
jgi:hypothetical protein